jgi:glutamyl-tRNA synthetase
MKEGRSVFVRELRDLGYTPEGVVNWIALMGASFDEKQDVFSLPELVERFSLNHLTPAPAAVNFTKADHFNGVHLRRLPLDELARRMLPFFTKAGLSPDESLLRRIAPLIQERVVTLDDGVEMAGFFFRKQVVPEASDLVGKDMTPAASAEAVHAAIEIIAEHPDLADPALEAKLRHLADRIVLKPGQLFGILRAAVTGQTVSPPLFGSMAIIGRETVLARLAAAEKTLRGM